MNPSIKQSFPSFSNTLIDAIDQNANEQFIPAGTVIMHTGQYIKNTMLVIRNESKARMFPCPSENPRKSTSSIMPEPHRTMKNTAPSKSLMIFIG